MATKKIKKPASKKPDSSQLPGSRVETSFRKHIFPPLMGLFSMLVVLAWFNSQLIASKISTWTYKPPTEVVAKDETAAQHKPDPSAPSSIIINGIAVEAPVIYDQITVNEANFQTALQKGVVHYPNTAVPGEPGNVVIFGHSSGQVWAPGDYKFIFARLEKLKPGDKIFLDYQGQRYTYEINELRVVKPTEMSVLKQDAGHNLTLITCTPVGTNTNRLIVSAKQITPKPNQNLQPSTTLDSEIQSLPGSSPALVDVFRDIF